ncbi:unnamed protein product [Brugia timori]|uniref:Phosphomannomutase n=1 Tax=Brugia timori TaxID=42155 RepID=A0A3P7Z1D5_9BILA|nr:unnamed protein product [Brugia timori]
MNRFDYVFSENGLVSVSRGTTFPVQSIKHLLGEKRLKELINFTLREFSKIDLPIKLYDEKHGVRKEFVRKLENFTEGWNLNIRIGGQISIDVFPYGWDKRYCLQFLDDFHTIHFFGDKTAPGGNDYDLFIDPRTTGYTVKDPKDTREQVRKLLETL